MAADLEAARRASQRTVDRLTAADVLALYLQHPPRFNPGERWEYQNGGYVVLSHVVAKASDSTYVEFMRRRIFEALGMLIVRPGQPIFVGRLHTE